MPSPQRKGTCKKERESKNGAMPLRHWVWPGEENLLLKIFDRKHEQRKLKRDKGTISLWVGGPCICVGVLDVKGTTWDHRQSREVEPERFGAPKETLMTGRKLPPNS